MTERRSTRKKARELYKELSHEQHQFVASKQAAGTFPLHQWVEFLAPVASSDSARDAVRGLGRLMRPPDTPDALRLCVVPWLTILDEECRPGSLLGLRLDLRGTTDDKKLPAGPGGRPAPPASPRIKRIEESWWLDTWLVGDIEIHDGSRLQFQVADLHRRRRVTKISASGKRKNKVKVKVKQTVEVTLTTRNDRYQPTTSQPTGDVSTGGVTAGGVKVKPKPGERRTGHRLRASRALQSEYDPGRTLSELIAISGEAFRQVRPNTSPGGAEQ